MRDDLGVYYYPNPEDKSVRVYVRQGDGEIEFRLWHSTYKAMWDKHGWVPYSALVAAAEMYEGKAPASPLELYDANVAKALLKENERFQRK